MALRGKEETFVRRFAAGGNDGVPFNPRGYGDHSRRFAARGNEIVDHENFRESCDGYHPRRFAARGNEDPDLIYDSSPVFDEYEDDVWYAWATGGSYRCGFDEAVRLSENSLSPKIAVVNGGHMRSWDYRRSSQSLDDGYLTPIRRKKSIVGLKNVCNVKDVKGGGPTVVISGSVASLIIPSFMPREIMGSNVDARIMGFQLKGDNLNTQKINIANYVGDIVGMCDHVHENDIFEKDAIDLNDSVEPYSCTKNCKIPYNLTGPLYLSTMSGGPCRLSMREQHKDNAMDHYNGGSINAPCKLNSSKHNAYPLHSKLVAQTCVEVKQTSGPENYSDLADGPKMGELDFDSLVNKMHSNTSFDPGGTSQLGDTTCEVKMFRRVMITIINGNRVDVPFDPGGFDPKAKLEDEFFSKTGSMMQGY